MVETIVACDWAAGYEDGERGAAHSPRTDMHRPSYTMGFVHGRARRDLQTRAQK